MSGYLGKKGVYISATDVGTESSPTYTGMTLSGLTASTVIYSNASKALTSLANSAGYLLNDGSGGLSWGAVDTTPFWRIDGTSTPSADWNMGAYDLTATDITATNFKLSGTGTLTSTAGNVSLTTALTAASGNEVAYTLTYTTNKAAGNDFGLTVNQIDTASPGLSYLLALQKNGVSQFYVDDSGNLTSGNVSATAVNPRSATLSSTSYQDASTGNLTAWSLSVSTAKTNTSGTYTGFSLATNYNQASGTASNTDLLISRTSTATGSGAQLFIEAKDDTVIRYKVDTDGNQYLIGANSQSTNFKMATVVVTTTAAATATATNLIPAGSMVVGVTCRNTTAVTGDAGFTGYSIGDGSDADRWGANVNPSINESTDLTDCTITSPAIYAAATSVVLTQVGGSTFNASATIRVTVHYISLTSPTT